MSELRRVTVCQLRDAGDALEADWEALCRHVRREGSDLVLLPEMPFCPWPVATPPPESAERRAALWQAAVDAHARWLPRLAELGAPFVCASRPVARDGRRLNEGFVWEQRRGDRPWRDKTFLPNEPGFWEAAWYARGPVAFDPTAVGDLTAGLAICTEIWFTEHARAYARAGAHLLLCPRATEAATTEKWVIGGRVAAVMSGAYCLSSNRAGRHPGGVEWGGCGWICEPDQGALLAVTSAERPFVTATIDPALAVAAKRTYPRDVLV